MFIVIIVGQRNLMRIFMLVKLSINSQCWIQPRVLPAMLMVKLYSERETDRGEESYPVVSHEGGYIWRLEPNLLFDTTKVNIGNFQQKILPQFKKDCIIFLVFVVSALQHYH